MTILAFLAGLVTGALSAFAFCGLWALRAMHPHDEVSDLERYAGKAERRVGEG